MFFVNESNPDRAKYAIFGNETEHALKKLLLKNDRSYFLNRNAVDDGKVRS